jgi:CheY-like chemotaxis protein
MKILVVDDCVENIEAAKKQLGGEHELTCCGDYDEAESELVDKRVQGDGLVWDVALLDGVMGVGKYDGVEKEIVSGYSLSIFAAAIGVEKIAILSSSSHSSVEAMAFNPAHYYFGGIEDGVLREPDRLDVMRLGNNSEFAVLVEWIRCSSCFGLEVHKKGCRRREKEGKYVKYPKSWNVALRYLLENKPRE